MGMKEITYFELLKLVAAGKEPTTVTLFGVTYTWDGAEYVALETNKYLSDELVDFTISAQVYGTFFKVPEAKLTEPERAYLKAVCDPFRDKVEYITKTGGGYCYVSISLRGCDCIILKTIEDSDPFQFLDMETNKQYTLEDLGI